MPGTRLGSGCLTATLVFKPIENTERKEISYPYSSIQQNTDPVLLRTCNKHRVVAVGGLGQVHSSRSLNWNRVSEQVRGQLVSTWNGASMANKPTDPVLNRMDSVTHSVRYPV